MKHLFSMLTAVFAVLAFLISCGGSEGTGGDSNVSSDTGEIYGRVIDKDSGDAISASVELRDAELRTVHSYDTGSNGQFVFSKLTAGTYTLYVTKTGYIDQTSSEIIIKAGQRTQRDVPLEKKPAALRIVDDNNNDMPDLDFGSEIDVVLRVFNVLNSGLGELEWHISYPDSAKWIKEIKPDGGTLKAKGKEGVAVTIDRSLLKSGYNEVRIIVTSNDGNKELIVKATNATVPPTLNTLEPDEVTSSSAVLKAKILTNGDPSYSERGFVYALTSTPTLEDKDVWQLTAKVTEEETYSALATGLELGKEYYVRGYARNEAGVAYSTNEVKVVPKMRPPEVQTDKVSDKDLESRSATFNGTILDEGDPVYEHRGFVYSLTPNPILGGDKVDSAEVPGKTKTFSAKVEGLEVGKFYYVRAYAQNDAEVKYGEDVELNFNGTTPEVRTTKAAAVSRKFGTATFEGEITDVGDPAYSDRGFVYDINHNPTIETAILPIEVPGTDKGPFSINVEGLVMGNIYYVRAYAKNAQGIDYGNEITLDFRAQAPKVTTIEPDKINLAALTATLKGKIVDGDPAYEHRGFVYGFTSNPTIGDSNINKAEVPGIGSGEFSADISGLEIGKVYYVRAYATTSEGTTTYGLPVPLDMTGRKPAVTTTKAEVVSIEYGKATFEGNVTDEGDPAYNDNDRGFVYGFTHNPSIEDNTARKETVPGTGSGVFSANITNLEMNKIYYVRAYAENAVGVNYGDEIKLDFRAKAPTVTTNEPDKINLAARTATLKGKIVDGDPAYEHRGFVYGFIPNPTIDDSNVNNAGVPGTGSGEFSANISGLELGKVYYVRAYATTSQGTTYSEQQAILDMTGSKPTVTTTKAEVVSIEYGKATFEGNVTGVGDPEYDERGFVYGLTHNPSIEDNTARKETVPGTGTGVFSANITNLEMNKIYYVRTYVKNAVGVNYGDEMRLDFSAVMPVVKIIEATVQSIGGGTAVFKGSIEALGDPAYTDRGFVYGFTHNPSVEDETVQKKTVPGTGTGVFSANITNLEMNKIYYVRAYATSPAGTEYGITEIKLDFRAVMPVVSTNEVTDKNIGAGTATFNGLITNVGDPAYTERGFVYGLAHNPTVDDDTKKVVSGTGTGVFSANVTNLEINNKYYIRAYATSAAGTEYGTEVEADFSAVKPVVTTNAVTDKNIGAGTATFNGTITNVGDPAYTERGFVYGLAHNPTVDDDTKKVVSGTGTGVFSANVTNLEINNKYYIRAYATSAAGTEYGTEVEADFSAVKPVVTTNAVTDKSIAAGTATFNGTITDVGDPAYTERGFVYGLAHNPTVDDDTKKIVTGIGTGVFSANITNLEMNKIYYVRAYAITSQGTVYGSEVMMEFNPIPASVETNSVLDIDATTATLSATITDVGDPAYTEKGFVYSKTQHPTILNNKVVVSGNGSGTYTLDLTELETSVTYYVRAYVISNNNVIYGNEVSFYTESKYYSYLLSGGIIVAKEDAGKADWSSAIAMCQNSTLAGFDDWRLPTKDELANIYNNKDLIGNFKDDKYWSSSWNYSSYYYDVNFSSGVLDYDKQASQYYVRCVRSLTAAVETNAVSNIDLTTATLNATVTAVGDPAYTERGFVYSNHQNPTTLDNKIEVSGSGSGSYSWDLTDLETQVTYYVRAYVISNGSVIYGNEVTFYTGDYYVLDNGLIVAREDAGKSTWEGAVDMCKNSRLAGFSDWHLPTIGELSMVYSNKDLIGNFKNDSYWSSSYHYDYDGLYYYFMSFSIYSNGGIGSNGSTQQYYVRCVRSLTSAVETNEVINVDLTTATLSATVISIGDPAYSERGFVYSKHQNPTTLDNKVVVSGSGAGTYTWNLSGLETRVTYYVKAYVISNGDIIYGSEVSFYTESPYYYVLSDDLIVAREDVGEAGWYSAFDLCSNSRLGGFNDWRLPTIDELVTVYNNLESIGNFTYDVVYGPYESEEYVALYLSSSEYDEVEDAILVLDFIDGAMGYAYKTDVLHVRCVR